MKRTRQTNSPRLRTKLTRRITIAVSLAVLITGVTFFISLNFTPAKRVFGAVNGDYRSKASGNWNSTATWQKYNGTSWINAVATPTSADGTITILAGHTVTVTADVTVDQTIVNAGGVIVINSSRYLYEANGTGTDLQVDGAITLNNGGYLTENASSTIVVNGTITLASGSDHQIGAGATCTINSGGRVIDNGCTIATTAGKWTVNSGGVYQDNANGGNLPLATWNAGSTCEITGVTSTSPGNLNQSFQNFTWNCPSQSVDMNLNAAITSVGGDFTVVNTNASQLQLSSTGSATTISGDYIQSGGTFVLSTSSSSPATLNISGDYTQSGGTFSVLTGNGVTGTVNVSGNWTRTGGTITVGGNASTNAQFVFNKSGSQTFFTTGATVTGNVDFTVNSGSTLVMGNNILTGRNFTLSSGGVLSLGSAAGITASGSTGNIQSGGTRSYSTGADYIYNGTAAQNTGSGLPATVRSLTLTNSNNLTLTSTVSVSNTLTLTSGLILTGANEIRTTNTSTTSIQGYSASSYVAGNLRRSVTGTGTYDFPVGTSANYELATVTLSSATGFTDILGTFTNSNPIAAGLPLVGTLLSNLLIDKVLTYGYWSFTPNLVMLTGSYNITLNETGNAAATGPAYSYCAIKRANALASWQSTGTHIPGISSGALLSAGRSSLNSFGDYAIGFGQYLGFKGVTLISGVAGQVNAIYKAPDVSYNIDCWIQIMSLDGGATLNAIDNFAGGNGYDEGWQPYIDHPANATSSILWNLTFKIAGTATDTTVGFLSITGVDVDGAGGIKEFVEATMPKSYALYSPTNLTVTNNNGTYRATSNNTGVANIDTAVYSAMYQINYQNLNTFLYRTGAIMGGSSAVRQHSLYFKSFFSSQVGLPIKLVYFKPQMNKDGKVDLNWATSSETNNDHFTVERSTDSENFEAILTKPGAGTSTMYRNYSGVDENPLPGYSYYRLKQTDYDGHLCYSEIQTVNNKFKDNDEQALTITSVAPNPFSEKFTLTYKLKTTATINLQLINQAGQLVFTDVIHATDGINQYDFTDQSGLPKGIYFINLLYEDKKITQKIIKNQ